MTRTYEREPLLACLLVVGLLFAVLLPPRVRAAAASSGAQSTDQVLSSLGNGGGSRERASLSVALPPNQGTQHLGEQLCRQRKVI